MKSIDLDVLVRRILKFSLREEVNQELRFIIAVSRIKLPSSSKSNTSAIVFLRIRCSEH